MQTVVIYERLGDRKPTFRESASILMTVRFEGSGSVGESGSRPAHDVLRDDAGREWNATAVAIAARYNFFGFSVLSGPAAHETASQLAGRKLAAELGVAAPKGGD